MASKLIAVHHPMVGPRPSSFSSLVFWFYPCLHCLLILGKMGLPLATLIFQRDVYQHGILLADTWNYFCCVCMAKIP